MSDTKTEQPGPPQTCRCEYGSRPEWPEPQCPQHPRPLTRSERIASPDAPKPQGDPQTACHLPREGREAATGREVQPREARESGSGDSQREFCAPDQHDWSRIGAAYPQVWERCLRCGDERRLPDEIDGDA